MAHDDLLSRFLLWVEPLDAVVDVEDFEGEPVDLPELEAGAPSESTPTLEEIEARLQGCQRCRLGSYRSCDEVVFARGTPGALLGVVGEGPGKEEDKRGFPFVGRSGEMLDNMVENVLKRDAHEDIYVVNVVKCRPPDDRTPDPDEVAACGPHTRQQLLACRPQVILALGRVAGAWLTGEQASVRLLRGRWWSWEDIPVRVTYHPAYLLRNPHDKRFALADLRAVKERLDELTGAA